jgi:hypothetical protein
MKLKIHKHQECLYNSNLYHKRELEGLFNQYQRLLYSMADDDFRQIQVDEAIRRGIDDFDSDKFMKSARLKAKEEAEQRITAQLSQLKAASIK